MNSITKLLLNTSFIAGIGAIASVSANAATLTPTNIAFNTTNYQTYFQVNGQDQFTPNNPTSAIAALTDSDHTSNVELWYTDENPTANVGFSANLGNLNVSVESITDADWAIFGSGWLTALTNRYGLSSQQTSILQNLMSIGVLPRSKDPNIGALTYDTNSSELNLTLVGFYDLKDKINDYLSQQQPSPATFLIQQALAGISEPLQMSEIAKVTINGEVSYAYSFSATPSGISTSDGTKSYTGLYSWKKTVAQPPTESVPEASTLLGILAIGGLFLTQRQKHKA